MIKFLELTPPNEESFRQAKIVKILVQEGEKIKVGHSLFAVTKNKEEYTLPSSKEGKVTELIAQEGDMINSMTSLLLLETTSESNANDSKNTSKQKQEKTSKKEATVSKKIHASKSMSNKNHTVKKSKQYKQQALDLSGEKQGLVATSPLDTSINQTNRETRTMSVTNVTLPDIGTDSAKIIEIHVQVGDTIQREDTLLSLESDKASMDFPSPVDGAVSEILVTLNQDISEGNLIIKVDSAEKKDNLSSTTPPETPLVENTISQKTQETTTQETQPKDSPIVSNNEGEKAQTETVFANNKNLSHASPSIRRFARELGVNLNLVQGSGRKNRINKKDITQFVKNVLSNETVNTTSNEKRSAIPPIPNIDFTQFGETETQPLNRIKKITAKNLHRAWLNIPHVTFNDEANITELELFRKQANAEYEGTIKLSPLAFIVKAVVHALQTFPQFNSSLDSRGENLIYKKYFNIGIAVDTPNGLMVPVIKQVDKKTISQIAAEMTELAKKARDKKLNLEDMSGACFTISSLGGIGGTDFTPIINPPEVAILGVSRNKMKPHWNGETFIPQMMLPLSLSFDHRVIDGAEAARFTRHIANLLEDIRRLTL